MKGLIAVQTMFSSDFEKAAGRSHKSPIEMIKWFKKEGE